MKWRFVLLTAALSVLGVGQATAQTRIVTGRVVDSLTGEVITSGQVNVAGAANIGTTVKDDGTFTLAVPARDVTVVIRSIGFKRKDVALPVSQNSVQASLERDYFQLEAIVVTGQATGVERRNLANAVSTVSSRDLVKTATTSVDQALQGKLAGAVITANNSGPGGGVQVRMRGVNSILGNGAPLWVVDGVIINNSEIGNGLNQVTRGGSQTCNPGLTVQGGTTGGCGAQDAVVNRAADLNPNDIESVEVLKGAAASAIYGSKANAGVILVTTKKGRVGAPQFNITQRIGTSKWSNRLGPFRRFSSAAEAATAFGTDANDGANNDDWTGDFFDYEETLFGNRVMAYETQASLAGGTENTRYFASGLLKRDGGILTNTYYEKQSLRFNVDQSVGSKLNFGFNVNPIHTSRAPGFVNNDNFEVSMYIVLPVVPTWLDIRQRADSTWPINTYANSNPLQTAAEAVANENVWRVINGAFVNYTPVNSATQTLKLNGTGGIDWYSKRDFVNSPSTLQYEPLDGFPGTVVTSATYMNQMNVAGSLVHTFKPSSGAFGATTSLGVSYEQRSFNFQQIYARTLLINIGDADESITRDIQNVRNKVRDFGFFGQEEVLLLQDRLLLTAGIRADQSSTNSDPTKLFYYPKFSGSYRMNVVRGVLDELKIRAAYGQSGNQPQYGDKFNQLTTSNIAGIPTARLGTTLIDPLRPERQVEIEAGIDATLLGARANLELTGYQRTIKDLLLNRSLIPSSGLSTQRFNGAQFRSRGIEAALSLVPIQTPSTQWQVRTTFSRDGTRIMNMSGVPPFNAGGSYQLGAARFIVDSSATDVWGNVICKEANPSIGSGCTGPNAIVPLKIGNLNPTFTLGFNSDLKWKAVSFNFLVSRQQGGMTSNLTQWLIDVARTSRDYMDACNLGTNMLGVQLCGGNVRRPGGAVTDSIPETLGMARERLFPARETSIDVENSSYWKLREVTVSIDIPRSLLNSFWSGARNARFSVSGRNLLTSTPYKGLDPEVSNNGTRNIRIGFDDIAPYPPSRSFWFSFDVGF